MGYEFATLYTRQLLDLEVPTSPRMDYLDFVAHVRVDQADEFIRKEIVDAFVCVKKVYLEYQNKVDGFLEALENQIPHLQPNNRQQLKSSDRQRDPEGYLMALEKKVSRVPPGKRYQYRSIINKYNLGLRQKSMCVEYLQSIEDGMAAFSAGQTPHVERRLKKSPCRNEG